jgi:cystathionine beta-lyase
VLREQVPLEATFGVGHFGVLGTLAAYRDGGAWRSQMLEVLDRRRRQLVDGLTRTEGVQVTWPEASYLAWVRIDGLGEDPAQVLLDEGNLALNSGLPFGGAGIGHVRINFATSETLLAEVLHSLGAVVRSRAS